LGYNYSAKRFDRVRSAYLFTLTFSTALMAVFAIACAICAPLMMKMFSLSDLATDIGSLTLRLQCLTMPLVPLNFMAGLTYQVVGNKLAAAALSVSRQGLFYIPLIFVLPPLFDITGIECMQSVSDVLSFLLALPFTFYFLNGLKNKTVGESHLNYYDGE
jgi:Na+-driven multidrug efflux pump